MVEAGKDLCEISFVRMLIQEISFMMSPPSWPTHLPEDYILIPYHCCSSVAKSCLALCDPMDCSMPGPPVLHYPQSLLKLMSIESVILSDHFILCRPLLLLPSIFPSIRIFSNELALHIRWPKYWSFSLSISPSNEHSGLISFRIDWFDVLVVSPRDSQGSSPAPQFECIIILGMKISTCQFGRVGDTNIQTIVLTKATEQNSWYPFHESHWEAWEHVL